MSILLRHADVDRQIAWAPMMDLVRERGAPRAPLFRQATQRDAPSEPARLADNLAVAEFGKVNLRLGEVRFDAQFSRRGIFEPKIDAGHIAGCHRAPGE